MANTDDVIKEMRLRVISGEIVERDMAMFFEFISDALADSLVNVAAEYRLNLDVEQAAKMVMLNRASGIH